MVVLTGRWQNIGSLAPTNLAVILLGRVRVNQARMCCPTLGKQGLTTSGNKLSLSGFRQIFSL